MLLLVILLLSTSSVFGSDAYSEKFCGEDLTKLWLDIVIVVDASKEMTDQGLRLAASDMSSLFVNDLELGVQPDEPRTTRVAIVSYDKNATEVASLNSFDSVATYKHFVHSSLKNVSESEESYLETGLQMAEDIFQKESFNTDRDHYKKLIIVYAASYDGSGSTNPISLSKRLKQDGIFIATVSWSAKDDKVLDTKLAEISSPGFNFSRQHIPVKQLRATMLEVNCFCPNNWFQMTDANNTRFGTCLIPVTLSATWTAAKFSCRNYWKNGYLVNEHTQEKRDFVMGRGKGMKETNVCSGLVQNNTAFQPPYSYFIGLSYSSGNWIWEQPSGQDQLSLRNWTAWSAGFPVSDSTKTVAVSQSAGWQNTDKVGAEYYVCEVATCDSTNYCEPDDD